MKIQKVEAPANMAARTSSIPWDITRLEGPGYNHAIRNVSDLESRYFVSIIYELCHIAKTCINTTIKAVKAIWETIYKR